MLGPHVRPSEAQSGGSGVGRNPLAGRRPGRDLNPSTRLDRPGS